MPSDLRIQSGLLLPSCSYSWGASSTFLVSSLVSSFSLSSSTSWMFGSLPSFSSSFLSSSSYSLESVTPLSFDYSARSSMGRPMNAECFLTGYFRRRSSRNSAWFSLR
ncbi:unnamed protein product [Prorocentrum cordatum]|uniref:Secreted protein n=1 Tax=Prorocentrum cordatum TaxID=2364126 RepID=A0ABN9XVV1_9DINO|nr:unnamed protein product [Polarella glacialis]